MRTTRFAAVLSLVCSFCCCAGCQTSPAAATPRSTSHNGATPAAPAAPDQRTADEIANAKLDKLIDVPLKDTKIVNVMEWFRSIAEVNVVVNWAALEAAGIEQDTQITLELRSVPARTAMKEVLVQAGAGAPLEPIGFAVHDGVVRVSTRRDLQRETQSRIYDISDLVELAEERRVRVIAEPAGMKLEKVEGTQLTREEVIEQIVTLIQEPVGISGEWAAYGGEVTSIKENGVGLYIKATPGAHADVQQVLDALRSQHRRIHRAIVQEQELVERLSRANALRLEGKHEDAMKEWEKAQLVRPDHPVVLAMGRVLDQAIARNAAAKPKAAPDPSKPQASSRKPPADPAPDSGTLPIGRIWSTADEPTREKLRKVINVRFDAALLVDAVAAWRKAADVNIAVNWAALEAAGIEQDMHITLSLDRVPASQALQLLLEQAGAGAPLEPLAFDISEGVVRFSTMRDLYRNQIVRAYDIRDILAWPLDDLAAQAVDPNPGEAKDVSNKEEPMFPDEAVEQVVTIIQDTVGVQGAWAAYGGDVASIREIRGQLIIKAPPAMHEEIEPVLALFRTAIIDRLTRTLQEQEIIPLLKEADTLRLAGMHEEAMVVVEKAVAIRPDHSRAAAMREVLKEIIARKKAK